MKIGIPRALFYYEYYPFWKVFFEALGQQVVLSSSTNEALLKKGVALCVDDACLPIKSFHGHVADLADKVDAIFIPRIVSIEPQKYLCPKFLGLPDMIRNSIPKLPPLIDAELNLYKSKKGIKNHVIQIGDALNKNKTEVLRAYHKAASAQKKYKQFITTYKIAPCEILPDIDFKPPKQEESELHTASYPKVLLVGHHYNIYDTFLSMNLVAKLKRQHINLITTDMVSDSEIKKVAKKLTKDMFWTLGERSLGAAFYFLDKGELDGIIHVASFGCGPDSFVGELLERKIKRYYKIPFLYLTLDEHAAEAGFDTRLEAFLDVLEGRKVQ
ncbi:hypothetical protein TSYNTROPHJE_12760 [Tepidanaerobacter syntrophicus]|uniref:acyl-CoA dehydratase activase-related protein n=1 Tax=Tepidanaerobacter syntrophicus TaxID=224999 RepID=UPI0022EEF0E1|nr:acyl-CoA dehydratase activase-related protein [Tepidanaerobacter syntrophicus]GLI19463.1 hypothetical protein TSYNTROPHJE_12760 [Tepidanaerobacter syntrophicus]